MKEDERAEERSRKIPNPDDEIPFSDENRVNPGVSGLIKEIAKIRAEAKAKEAQQDSNSSRS